MRLLLRIAQGSDALTTWVRRHDYIDYHRQLLHTTIDQCHGTSTAGFRCQRYTMQYLTFGDVPTPMNALYALRRLCVTALCMVILETQQDFRPSFLGLAAVPTPSKRLVHVDRRCDSFAKPSESVGVDHLLVKSLKTQLEAAASYGR